MFCGAIFPENAGKEFPPKGALAMSDQIAKQFLRLAGDRVLEGFVTATNAESTEKPDTQSGHTCSSHELDLDTFRQLTTRVHPRKPICPADGVSNERKLKRRLPRLKRLFLDDGYLVSTNTVCCRVSQFSTSVAMTICNYNLGPVPNQRLQFKRLQEIRRPRVMKS